MKKRLKRIYICFIFAVMMTVLSGSADANDIGAAVPTGVIDPESETGYAYGCTGTAELKAAAETSLEFTEGEHVLEDMQITGWETPVIQNTGDSILIARNCYLKGETAEETVPLAGAPASLLIAGNMRTTLAMNNSQGYYINSMIVSRNWAVLSTDAAQPADEEGGQEAGVYAYGSEVVALEGGYGAYSDIFCGVYLYGSRLQSPEIGIISGSYGKVIIGNIEDGENNPQLSQILSGEDKENRQNKEQKTIVAAGRNALMIHSLNLPYYWHFDGCSEEELANMCAVIKAHDCVFRTDLSLEKEIAYDDQQKAYIDHTKGSVLLIKSTNTEMELDGCELIPDAEGTGYLIQTVFNNDTLYMIPVPDGQTLPGIHIVMKNMHPQGNISHEDYQRDLYLELDHTEYTGAMNQYGFEYWKKAAASEGFTDYCTDTDYSTHHGLHVSLTGNSVWNVTGESCLTDLEYEPGCSVNGLIFLDGVLQTGEEGSWHGDITVKPF